MVTFGGGRPAYQQVADEIRREILDGTLRPRPTLRRRSVTWYDPKPPGSPTAQSIEAQGGVPSWDHESERGEASTPVAERLGIEPGAPVMITRYVYKADGVPIQLAVSWEPLAITAGTPIEWPEDSGRRARDDHRAHVLRRWSPGRGGGHRGPRRPVPPALRHPGSLTYTNRSSGQRAVSQLAGPHRSNAAGCV